LEFIIIAHFQGGGGGAFLCRVLYTFVALNASSNVGARKINIIALSTLVS